MFWYIFLQAVNINVALLLDSGELALAERRKFLKYGELGDLLYDPNSFESVRRWDVAAIDQVFDNISDEWVDYKPEEIIHTYSLVPRPPNKAIELDYFIRSWPLVRHHFIWADDFVQTGIPQYIISKIFSRLNHANLGRFTIRRELPTLQNPARMVNYGFIEQDANDMLRLF